MSKPKKNPHAVALGRIGGNAKSAAKTQACRMNAQQPRPGGRNARAKEAKSKPLPKRGIGSPGFGKRRKK